MNSFLATDALAKYKKYMYKHQIATIESDAKYKKSIAIEWCGTGKTRTFTLSIFIYNQNLNVIVVPSLNLINQYNNDYILSNEEPFKTEFKSFECLSFCSDDEKKLKIKDGRVKYTTNERKLGSFLKKPKQKLILVTYQSFEKFVGVVKSSGKHIDILIYDEAHHIVGDKIQNIVFRDPEFDAVVGKTTFYTATAVNRNGIVMYDRECPENSDCGPISFEYPYYCAVEDGICKPFEVQIPLYTQKPEYKTKYHAVFDIVIRACLSGQYDYWNILTYHSYVNDNDDCENNTDNDSTFVKNFVNEKNQNLLKERFTYIQNTEFPETKEIYNVDDVILKGIYSKSKHNNDAIMEDFNQHIPGRIFILSSCGMINEGKDTTWANMNLCLNPSKSTIKTLQRIGRLSRKPEIQMGPGIVLIPCQIDITAYDENETEENKSEMIQDALMECGNYTTSLNVISALKSQYDPEIYEMCLRYPNMYSPQEIKTNLEKYKLTIQENQGDLVDVLQSMTDMDLSVIPYEDEDMDNEDILQDVSEMTGRPIEVHTQNYENPIETYIGNNGENVDLDCKPLRLFYCEDDEAYKPIIAMETDSTDSSEPTESNISIKIKEITEPKKRKPLYNVYAHPDLDITWKLNNIQLNEGFGQGVLDVNVLEVLEQKMIEVWKEQK
jgi:superfamily II DNA or RNA helicase